MYLGTNCEAIAVKYNYEAKTDACYQFDYTGCGPEGENRFDSMDECMNHCSAAQYIKNATSNNEQIGKS